MHPFCPICGAREFIEFNGRAGARCSDCGAMERTRLLYAILNRHGVLSPKLSVLHLAPELGLAKRLRSLAETYVAADINVDQYAKQLPEVRRIDLCDFEPSDFGSFSLIVHMHVLEHVPCSVASVLVKLSQMLAPGGRMYFSVPIRSDAYTTEDLDPRVTAEQRKTRFGQHDHQRIFGELDVVGVLGGALGGTLSLVEPLACFSVTEIRLMGIQIDVAKLSGHSIFCYKN